MDFLVTVRADINRLCNALTTRLRFGSDAGIDLMWALFQMEGISNCFFLGLQVESVYSNAL